MEMYETQGRVVGEEASSEELGVGHVCLGRGASFHLVPGRQLFFLLFVPFCLLLMFWKRALGGRCWCTVPLGMPAPPS